MKQFYIAVFTLMGLFSIADNVFGQSYCTPPKYFSGPYTGIIKVEIGSVSKSSAISDGYSDFSSTVQSINLTKGSEATINIDLYYDPSMLSYFEGNLNLRVWIDWNQNFVFDEPAETAVTAIKNCKSSPALTKFTAKFTIPANAKSGKTRMRVFNDMVETDGHDTPKPCGYLGSSNSLGQHGECEDYSVNISDATDVANDLINNEYSINTFPNPVPGNLSISYSNLLPSGTSISIHNSLGVEIKRFGDKELSGHSSISLSTAEISSGSYYITFNTGMNKFTRSFVVIK